MQSKEATVSRREIGQMLRDFGVPAHLLGYQYLMIAVEYCFQQKGKVFVTKDLYPKVAEYFGTKPSKVERSIRHAVHVAWERDYPKFVAEFRTRPTNSEFVATVTVLLASC